jgi:hypothetical protein
VKGLQGIGGSISELLALIEEVEGGGEDVKVEGPGSDRFIMFLRYLKPLEIIDLVIEELGYP